jgi:catechol 2,3-dioxygenase-like lactoylglutathione lyase family enzyme
VRDKSTDVGRAHLRIAHLSADLAAVVTFYRDGLGFEVLHEFKDHDGFDAVMLGSSTAAYHLAFVHKVGHKVAAPGDDNLLVFYVPDADDWQRAVARLEELGHRPVEAFNPYWDKKGKTFEDPDGYRIVLQRASWPVSRRS